MMPSPHPMSGRQPPTNRASGARHRERSRSRDQHRNRREDNHDKRRKEEKRDNRPPRRSRSLQRPADDRRDRGEQHRRIRLPPGNTIAETRGTKNPKATRTHVSNRFMSRACLSPLTCPMSLQRQAAGRSAGNASAGEPVKTARILLQ